MKSEKNRPPACDVPGAQSHSREESGRSGISHFDVRVTGMGCAACVSKIENTLSSMKGVSQARANLASETVSVSYFPDKISPERILRRLESIGYKPAVSNIDLTVEGISCPSCVAKIETSLKKIPGVIDASVNAVSGTTTITFDPLYADFQQFKKFIEGVGDYTVVSASDETGIQIARERAQEEHIAALKRAFAISAILTVFTGLISMGERLPLIRLMNDSMRNYVLLILTLPVMFWAGLRFLRGAVFALRHKTFDMNVLIALGTLSAFLYSVAVTFIPENLLSRIAWKSAHPHVYYDSAAMIITLMLLGRMLEARAKRKSSDAIVRLLGLRAKIAHVIREQKEIDIPADEVVEGDIVIVKPGEAIPADGVIIEGFSTVNESMITGEGMPVDKAPGDIVIGATINLTGAFKFRATKVGKETILYQIVRMMEKAQGSKAAVQRVADRVTSYFVPAVLSIAVITFICWLILGEDPSFPRALLNFVAVLIIACPCALGLATPTAIMVGMGRAAEFGLLFKGGDVLEKTRTINTIVFDKTGTLTIGEPSVTDVVSLDGKDALSVLRIAASAESASEHPIGVALRKKAEASQLDLAKCESFKAIPGKGVSATIDGKRVLVGKPAFVVENGISVSQLEKDISSLSEEGKTVMVVAVEDEAKGIIALADTVKHEAKTAIEIIKKMGLDVFLLSGDTEKTSMYVSKKLGIDTFFAEVLPGEKVDIISELKSQGRKVAMVGDGINDAPALASADIGIAVGAGTDIAIEASDITLIGDDLMGVPRALELSRKTYRVIKQNLFWAFFYNSLGIPVAAGVLYPVFGILLNPVYAAVAMAFSSVSVVSNSLRLKRFQPGF